MRLILAIALATGLIPFAVPAVAQGARTEEVRFPPGKTGTTIKGRITGDQSVNYTVGAEAGQVMTIRLRPSNRGTYFNVYEPGRGPGDQALAVSEMTGEMVPDLNQFKGKLPTSGTYTISVYLVRAAARRNETSRYTLDVAISALGKAEALPPVKADFADGLQGGPDFWEVTGVPKGDVLNLRRGPSAKEGVVTSVRNGAVLRNAGCRMSGGQRWCRVETTGGPAQGGWVAGRYLREGGPPAGQGQATSPVDATVAGTAFNATGNIPCARRSGQPMGSCRFGVVREGNGNGTVTVFWPDGGSRLVIFQGGTPVASDVAQSEGDKPMKVERESDLIMLRIGPERFEIPQAVISGG
jgi:hypothetical protein